MMIEKFPWDIGLVTIKHLNVELYQVLCDARNLLPYADIFNANILPREWCQFCN